VAEIVGIFSTPHAPPIVRMWGEIEAGQRERLGAAFTELGRRIRVARPDVLAIIGADHWANFFLDNLPAICIGVGTKHGRPPEAWLADYPHANTMVGSPELGMHLTEYAIAHGFEPSISHDMQLDHAFCVPLWKSGLNPLPAILPIVINVMQTPVPSMPRCLAFGKLLADAIRGFRRPSRVAILASGGLSHSVGEPMMGDVDEVFDRACIKRFERGDPAALLDYLQEDRIARVGNGTSEVRYWVTAHGAAGCRGFQLFHYESVPIVYTGCGFAQWI
jgi:aromatic ring-opening dioxygenase catalytic subunit (LigB family)